MSHSYEDFLRKNKDWISQKLTLDPDFFEKLSKEQHPEFLYIGCSDSRVSASEIMNINPGEVLIHRNIANLVLGVDSNVQSVIEYAVNYLNVKHIILCGHYGCGGIKAAMEPRDMGILNGWLRNVRDVYRLHESELDLIKNEETRYKKLVELNVREQCINIIKIASVQRNYRKKKFPIVHGWVYDLPNGNVIDLKIDFERLLKNVEKLYSIT